MSASDPIVFTAASAACSLGFGRKAILDAMLRGEVEINNAPSLEQCPKDQPRAAQVHDAGMNLPDDPSRTEHLVNRVLVAAVQEAGLATGGGERIETIFGTTLGGMRHVGEALRHDDFEAYRNSTTAGLNKKAMEGTGLSVGGITTSAACASGLATLAFGATALLMNEADMVVAVGYDPISEFAYAGFKSLRLVSDGPLRPFTADREGMRVGEGAAAFVLERLSSAQRRGVEPLGVLAGWGLASDAHHLTQPDPGGAGAAGAIREALRDGTGGSSSPDVVFCHATSTPANDAAEHSALSLALGGDLPDIPVTALKSRIGHTLGGAGAVECAIALEAMKRGQVPSVANAQVDRDSFPSLDLITGEPRAGDFNRALVVSLGFGGADAAVRLERDATPSERLVSPVVRVEDDELVAITGVGLLAPEDQTGATDPNIGVDQDAFAGLDEPRSVRRIARLARLVRAAGTIAAGNAGLDEDLLAGTAGFVASRFGAVEYTLDCYEEIVRDGLDAGNPLYFAESVPNIGSAQLSLGLGLKEGTVSIIGTRIAGLEAMHLARRHILTGQSDRAMVVAAEENDPRLHRILDGVGLLGEEQHEALIAEGSVALVLERASEAARRGARVLGWIRRTCVIWPESSDRKAGPRALRACATALAVGDEEIDLVPTPAPIREFEQRFIGRKVRMTDSRLERHSVGSLRELVRSLVQDEETGDQSVVMCDESGGSAGIRIHRGVPS